MSDRGGKDAKQGRQIVSFTSVDPMSESQKDEPHDVTKPRQVPYRTRWKVNQDAVYWINLTSAQEKGLAFWQTRSNAMVLDNPVPADCLQKVAPTKTEEILCRKIHLSPSLPPKVILKSSWQDRHEDHDQRGTSAGEPVASEPEIDFRIQGFSRAEVERGRKNLEVVDWKTRACGHASPKQRCIDC